MRGRPKKKLGEKLLPGSVEQEWYSRLLHVSGGADCDICGMPGYKIGTAKMEYRRCMIHMPEQYRLAAMMLLVVSNG